MFPLDGITIFNDGNSSYHTKFTIGDPPSKNKFTFNENIIFIDDDPSSKNRINLFNKLDNEMTWEDYISNNINETPGETNKSSEVTIL